MLHIVKERHVSAHLEFIGQIKLVCKILVYISALWNALTYFLLINEKRVQLYTETHFSAICSILCMHSLWHRWTGLE